MSFLTNVSARRLTAALPRLAAASSAKASRTSVVPVVSVQRHRSGFSTTALRPKTATEAAKDTLKSVDRAVADKLVDGIDIGSNVAEKVRGAAENLQEQVSGKASELQGKASELQGKASGKAAEVKGEAKGKANEMAGDAKGKAEDAADNIKDKAKDVAGDVKQKAEDVKKNL